MAAGEPVRNRVMLALAYDAALRQRGAVLAAHRRCRPGPPDAADPGGDDEEPAGAGGALLCAHGGAAVGLSRPPGDAFSSSGVPARIWCLGIAVESCTEIARGLQK